METNKFSVVMSEKVDMELVRIVTSERADYQPEAVIAAEEELKRRNITPVHVSGLYEGGGKTYRSGKGERGREAASSFICVGKSDSLSFPFSIVAYYRVGSYIVWLSNMW